MKKVFFFLALLFFYIAPLKVKSQTDSFFKYSYGMDEYRDELCLYTGVVSVNPLTPESVPLNGEIPILLSCVLLYFIMKMKRKSRIKLVAMMLIAVLFLRCTPDSDDGVTDCVEMKGRMGFGGGSRLQLGTDGALEWQRDDNIYMMSEGIDNTIAVFSAREINENNDMITLSCKYNAATCPEVMYRNLYCLGNWRYVDTAKITFSIYEQSGDKFDFGKHFVASARDVMFKALDKKTYTFTMAYLDPMVSVACFDMSLLDVDDVTIEYANCYNAINLEYKGIVESDYVGKNGYTFDRTDVLEFYGSGPIWVKTPSDETYVVLLPQKKPLPNTMVYFKSNGKVVASINFPKGISAGKLYLNSQGMPIVITADGERSETEVFEYNFYSE